jgi:hypothetical protein
MKNKKTMTFLLKKLEITFFLSINYLELLTKQQRHSWRILNN